MYSRTTRDTAKVENNYRTPSEIGPGTYSQYVPPYIRVNPVPFSHSSPRNGFYQYNDNPGPGTYSFYESYDKSSGTHTQKSTSNRFQYQVNSNPGPGEYFGVSNWKVKKQANSQPKSHLALTFTRVPTAPSIPSTRHKYGYEQGQPGELIILESTEETYAGDYRDSVGPGAYNPIPQSHLKSSMLEYDRTTSDRTDFSITPARFNPGPGSYNFDSSMSRRGVKSVFQSSVQKGLDLTKQQNPGPGSYNYPSSINIAKGCTETESFGSRADRFKSLKTPHDVGPGSYQHRSSFNLKTSQYNTFNKNDKDISDSHKVPFLSNDKRFKEVSTKDNPSLQYDITGFADRIDPTPNSAFVSGVPKCNDKIDPANGPGSYNPQHPREIQSLPYKAKQSSIFMSTTDRTKYDINHAPPPGSYTQNVSWNRNVDNKYDRYHPRFTSNISDVPGPGAYHPRLKAIDIKDNNARNRLIFGTKRSDFTVEHEGVPGPGSYYNENDKSLLDRPTFNVLIAQNKLSVLE